MRETMRALIMSAIVAFVAFCYYVVPPVSVRPPTPVGSQSAPSGHLTFSQIQKALKAGRPIFCNCPRCRAASPGGQKPADRVPE